MKRLYLLFALAVCLPAALFAQQTESKKKSAWHLTIPEVTVIGHRPMKEIGVQKTKFDSLALKENIALSMADILTFNSSVFVKSYGRATLSTVAFRGTSPSHTQVTWNGMRINNPMLGMTDFSTIPSYFIDQASLLHGTSSVNETGGGTRRARQARHRCHMSARASTPSMCRASARSARSTSSLRLTYGSDRWHVSPPAPSIPRRPTITSTPTATRRSTSTTRTRTSSDSTIPWNATEAVRSRICTCLQEVYYDTRNGDKVGLNAWYINSNRELPMLTTDYGDATDFENRQREQTFPRRRVMGPH